MTDQADGVATLRERVRERLAELIRQNIFGTGNAEDGLEADGEWEAADAILREFRLQPVAVGKVGDGGEVEMG